MDGYSSWPNYKFGVELEMFLVFKHLNADIENGRTIRGKLERAADHIIQRYSEAIRGSDVIYHGMESLNWRHRLRHSVLWGTKNSWEVHNDPSLYPFGIAQCNGWPLEFASPIFDYSVMMVPDYAVRGSRRISPWLPSIIKLFHVLEDETIILVDDERAALQVSVSTNDHYGWDNLDQVKSLAKSILYFESAIRTFLPQPRRDNNYAKWNGSPTQMSSTTSYMNPRFQDTSGGVGSRIALVDACATLEDLVKLMNNGGPCWSWNFMDLKADLTSNLIHGRVEFRSPPGVDNWRECAAWIHFTMEFVHAAVSTQTTIHRLVQFEDDWDGLMKFLDSVYPLISKDSKLKYRRELGIPDH